MAEIFHFMNGIRKGLEQLMRSYDIGKDFKKIESNRENLRLLNSMLDNSDNGTIKVHLELLYQRSIKNKEKLEKKQQDIKDKGSYLMKFSYLLGRL